MLSVCFFALPLCIVSVISYFINIIFMIIVFIIIIIDVVVVIFRRDVKDNIESPFIAICALNENWLQ